MEKIMLPCFSACGLMPLEEGGLVAVTKTKREREKIGENQKKAREIIHIPYNSPYSSAVSNMFRYLQLSPLHFRAFLSSQSEA